MSEKSNTTKTILFETPVGHRDAGEDNFTYLEISEGLKSSIDRLAGGILPGSSKTLVIPNLSLASRSFVSDSVVELAPRTGDLLVAHDNVSLVIKADGVAIETSDSIRIKDIDDMPVDSDVETLPLTIVSVWRSDSDIDHETAVPGSLDLRTGELFADGIRANTESELASVFALVVSGGESYPVYFDVIKDARFVSPAVISLILAEQNELSSQSTHAPGL